MKTEFQQAFMFSDLEMGSDFIAAQLPGPAIKKRLGIVGSKADSRKARVSAAEADFLARQIGFGDDIMGAITVVEIAEESDAHIDAALTANPSILPPSNDQLDARGNLEFARFMRAAGVPKEEVTASLSEAGLDAVLVMEQLSKVEAVIGADYPTEVIVDLALDADECYDEGPDEEGSLDGDIQLDADVAEDEPGAVEVASFKSTTESSSTALASLLKNMRGARFQPLTVEAETALGERVKAGDAAATTQLAEHNMRFLVMMAKRFRYTGRPLDELISAGTIGLIAAAKKFDPARGRFTTCAQHWIRQSIQRSLMTDTLMKTPAYMPALESKLRKEADLAATAEERDVLLVRANSLKREITARRAVHVSLDGGQGDDSDGGDMHNMFAAADGSVEDSIETARLLGWLIRAANTELKTMEGKSDARARDVFLMRVGLHPLHQGAPQTLAEVADIFEVSRERIRQIYSDAALEVVNAVEHYAHGADNLPDGFRDGILGLGRRAGAVQEVRDPGLVAMDSIFAAESAGPGESQKRVQLVAWLVKAANRELKTESGTADTLSRDVFLMRIGLHQAYYGTPQSVAQVGRNLAIKQTEVRTRYDEAAEEIAYAVEHYAKDEANLPADFRKSLRSHSR